MCKNLRNVNIFIAIQALLWVILYTISSANLDSYGDMLESFSWGQTWALGTHKHPPFLGWVTYLWFSVFPKTNGFFFLLSYTCVGVSLVGIAALAKLFLKDIKAVWLSVFLIALALPYSTLAAKFNANSILLPLWPWTAWYFLKVVDGTLSIKKRNIYSIGLGILAAISMLGKYYSGVFLLSIFVISWFPQYSTWYKTYLPYLSLTIFLLCLAPHATWLIHNHYPSLTYIAEQGAGTGIDWHSLVKFSLSPIIYWGVPWAVILIVGYQGDIFQRITQSIKRQSQSDALWYLCALPLAITLIFGVLDLVTLSLPWSIPIGFSYTILLVRNIPVGRIEHIQDKVIKAIPYYYIVILVGAILMAYIQGIGAARKFYLPRVEMSQAIQNTWETNYSNAMPLAWATGNWPEVGMLAFYQFQKNELRALPSAPDEKPAIFIPEPSWENSSGIFYCPLGWKNDALLKKNSCTIMAERWISSHGRAPHAHYLTAQKIGVLFPQVMPYEAVVYFYPVALE